jgi:hypothetical protein
LFDHDARGEPDEGAVVEATCLGMLFILSANGSPDIDGQAAATSS